MKRTLAHWLKANASTFLFTREKGDGLLMWCMRGSLCKEVLGRGSSLDTECPRGAGFQPSPGLQRKGFMDHMMTNFSFLSTQV